jgi:hypothetical protein
VPVGNVLVGNAGGDIEHDDTGLTVDVVTITETTELLLTSGIPDIELDGSVVLIGGLVAMTTFSKRGSAGYMTYGVEAERVNLDTKGGDVLLLEFTSQVTLDESGLLSLLVMKSR